MTITDGPHHRDGIPWYETEPLLGLLHRCSVQTWGTMGPDDDQRLVERCGCGAIRINGGRWAERNARAWSRWKKRLHLR